MAIFEGLVITIKTLKESLPLVKWIKDKKKFSRYPTYLNLFEEWLTRDILSWKDYDYGHSRPMIVFKLENPDHIRAEFDKVVRNESLAEAIVNGIFKEISEERRRWENKVYVTLYFAAYKNNQLNNNILENVDIQAIFDRYDNCAEVMEVRKYRKIGSKLRDFRYG